MTAHPPVGRQAPYEPPKQGMRGQFVDALLILALVFGALFVTTYVGYDSGQTAGSGQGQGQSLSQLDLTAAERQQYGKMIDAGMIDRAGVNDAVEANNAGIDKYQIAVLPLVAVFAILIVYLAFVYRVSFREYREVINEKFGARPQAVRDDRE